jgi:hypothetical protein
VLEVEVARRALPPPVAACNRSPRTLVGVAFGLSGASAADLSVDPGKAPVQYVRGSVYRFDGTFTVRNNGPSAALGGAFAFRAQIGFLNGVIDPAINPPKATAPFGPCTAAGGPDSGPLTVTCPFNVFPSGATATVSLTSVVKIPADEPLAGVYDILADWSIASFTAGSTYSGTRDPQPSNNTQSEVVHLCGPQATDPKCPAAPGG